MTQMTWKGLIWKITKISIRTVAKHSHRGHRLFGRRGLRVPVKLRGVLAVAQLLVESLKTDRPQSRSQKAKCVRNDPSTTQVNSQSGLQYLSLPSLYGQTGLISHEKGNRLREVNIKYKAPGPEFRGWQHANNLRQTKLLVADLEQYCLLDGFFGN